MPIQQIFLGAGGSIEQAKYIDEVFSTSLFTGTTSTQLVTNELNLLNEGGLVWSRTRDASDNHRLTDTARGVNKTLSSDATFAEYTTSGVQGVSQFTSAGFYSGLYGSYYNDDDIVSWCFRRAKGFFDVVKFEEETTGDQTINHQLGCMPGMIIFKRYDSTGSWYVWHHSEYNEYAVLDSTQAWSTGSQRAIGNVTATSFNVKFGNIGAGIGSDYVAYVFAGSESPDNASRGVVFSSSHSNRVTIPDNDDFDLGTGDFTIECWVKVGNVSNTGGTIFSLGDKSSNNSIRVEVSNSQFTHLHADGSARLSFPGGTLAIGQWRHIAVTKSSNVLRYFVDGISSGSTYTQTNSVGNGSNGFLSIGARPNSSSYEYYFDGAISNFRIVKGTAVYTSSFRPSNRALTNVTNTVLLCLNELGITASTVTPATISSNGYITQNNDGPFDDPAGFVFGDAQDQPVIKTGSYIGTGQNWAQKQTHVTLGFEPQWVLIKNSDEARDWKLYDSMRGIPTDGGSMGSPSLKPNNGDREYASNATDIVLTATGFFLMTNSMDVNGAGDKMIYLAIRRPDAYVSKPRTATELFSTVTGVASDTIPAFASGFPVDMGIYRKPASTSSWSLNARIMGGKGLQTFSSGAQIGMSSLWDNNSRFGPTDNTEYNSDYQSWAWRRSAGFTTVAYEGDGIDGREIAHDLGPNNVPEMMWIKHRELGTGSTARNWMCYHKGLNGGTNPSHYYVNLNNENVQVNEDRIFNDTEPTSTHFTVGDHENVNTDGKNYIALLFSSVSGISKCGYYDGSNSGVSLTTGFQPRFLIIRRITGSQNARWTVFDTLRGLGTTSQSALFLDATESQSGVGNIVTTSSTGFSVAHNSNVSQDNDKYVYYAHA